MQLSLVLNLLKHDLVLTFGAGVTPEDEEEGKEILVVESTGDHSVRQVGFTRVEEEDDDDVEDAHNGRLHG
jgi:hypothetical protein